MRYFRQFQHLLPRSEAWSLVANKRLRQLFQALGTSPTSDSVDFVDDVWLDIFPQTTRELEAWEQQYALSGTGTDQERRDLLDARWKAQGGQSPRYIQDILQAAGFPVYVHQWWTAGTAYTDSTQSLAVGGGGTGAESVFMRPDGTQFFTAHNTTDDIVTWNLSTAYDVSTGIIGSTHDVASEEPAVKGVAFSRDGGRMFVYGAANKIFQYDLGTPWDVLTAGFTVGDELDTSAEVASLPNDLHFSRDGTLVFVVGQDSAGDGTVFQYELATSWDVTTGSYGGVSYSTTTQTDFPTAIWFADSGFTMWIGEDGTDKALKYTMGVQYDIANAVYDSDLDPSFSNPNGLCLSDDSKNLYILDRNTGTLDQYWRGQSKDPRDYTQQPLVGRTQCGDALAECGEQPPDQESSNSAVCGSLLANEVGYLVNDDLSQRPPPSVPDDPATWPYFLYIGDATFPNRVDIFDYQRADFERLLLQICPTQQWLVVRVNYIATPLTSGSPITYIV